jgi:large subunit ribosomal protein L21
MEYAIVELGGHQMWVEEGQHFIMNRIKTNPGTNILFNRVLLVKKKESVIGYPYVKNAFIKGEVLEHLRGSKILVYKMKSKKGYRRKKGHRQELTKLKINHIKINN